MFLRELERELAPRRLRLELSELQTQALGDAPRADPGGIEGLHVREHLLDLVEGDGQIGGQALRDVGERLGEIAVVVQRVDDCLAYPHLARIERADFELPDQVLVEVTLALVGELERPVVVVVRSLLDRLAWTRLPTGRPSRR